MRVLLIDFNPFAAPVTAISLGSLGAVLQRSGHEVRMLGLGSTSSFSVRDLSSFLRSFTPELVGFGTYQRNFLHVRAMARLAKQVLPGCRVVLGGPQALFLPEEGLAALPEVDFLCRGEGELVIETIVDAVASGSCDAAIPGATTRLADGSCLSGEPPDEPLDLDEYPSPWLAGVLDPAELEESVLLTSRGCPFDCVFCITPAACGRRCRHHSVARVLEDITYVAQRGSGRLWFADPNFCCRESRVAEILEGVLQRDLDVSMWLETRADMVTDELIVLMKRAGVSTLAMGLESASPEVFPGLRKHADPELVADAARAALAAGMDVELFSQFALPGESFDNAMQTLSFVRSCGVPIRGNSNAQQMQLYFGSEIHAAYEKHGVKPLREAPPYLSIGADFETEWMSRAEIDRVKAAWRAASLDGGKRVVS